MNNEEQHRQLNEAGMYNVLSDYYKYINPELHIYYYQKHLQSIKHLLPNQDTKRTFLDTQKHTEYGKIRILHGSRHLPSIDIYINGIKIYKEISYKKMTNEFTLPAGKYQIDIYETGKMIDTFCSQKISVDRNKFQTIILSNFNQKNKLYMYHEISTVPANEASLRFIHLVSNMDQLDIAVQKGDIVFPRLSPSKASRPLGIYPMTVQLEARSSNKKEMITTFPPLTLKENKAYTAVLFNGELETEKIELLLYSL